MTVFIDESTSSYDKEERLIFFAENESGLKAAHVVFSGNVFMSNTELRGDNDNVHNNTDVEMMVGPYLLNAFCELTGVRPCVRRLDATLALGIQSWDDRVS